MYTRTHFQKLTGLTRKAIRTYEKRGLLTPIQQDSSSAVYPEKDIKSARLIKQLRNANISIAKIFSIQQLTGQAQNNVIKEVLDEINENIKRNHTAKETLSACLEENKAKPVLEIYGGFFAVGRSALLPKSKVANFVSDFSKTSYQIT